MTLDEKIAMLHGVSGSPYIGHIPANKRLGIPALNLEDGPAGVGDELTGVTELPAPVAAAASWDRQIMRHYGAVLGAEDRGKGVNVALAPMMNIVRDPRWGRAFETLSEDPYLTSQLGVAEIQGIQHQGVIAQAKHWDVNNQETHRHTGNVRVSRRALHEIYMPAFKAAVQQGHIGSLMCAYNKVRSKFACENPYLLTEVLRQQWGFKGFVTSDWGATHSTVASAKAGLDMEMSRGTYFGAPLKAAVRSGKVSKALIDAKVHHILLEMFRFGLFDHPSTGSVDATVTSPAHARFARHAAEQGSVLLKNKHHILPLGKETQSIMVVGRDAGPGAMTAGGGSSLVVTPYVVIPYEAIRKRARKGVTVRYAQIGVAPRGSPAPAISDATLRKRAAGLARSSDVAVVFVNDYESENKDRAHITLPGDQNQLIEAVAKANSNTIVVLNTGAPVTMPWVKQVAGIIEAWYPGQEDGNAIASVLFGDVNPSGHLPVTFPKSLKQVPAHTRARWPGVDGTVHYSEGLLVGYRWYGEKNIKPLFPFGYGLSYTHFQMQHLKITPARIKSGGRVRVSFDIANTGKRAGADVVQLYVGDPASVGEPPKQLKAFRKVHLQSHAHTQVTFQLGSSAFSYWDSDAQRWAVKAGTYRIYVGDSSRHLPLKGKVEITRNPQENRG
jgi:beta-glucosidase